MGTFSRFEIINERTIWVDGELKEDLVFRRMLGINAYWIVWHIASVWQPHDIGGYGCFIRHQ